MKGENRWYLKLQYQCHPPMCSVECRYLGDRERRPGPGREQWRKEHQHPVANRSRFGISISRTRVATSLHCPRPNSIFIFGFLKSGGRDLCIYVPPKQVGSTGGRY